jgi:hypothetical protein
VKVADAELSNAAQDITERSEDTTCSVRIALHNWLQQHSYAAVFFTCSCHPVQAKGCCVFALSFDQRLPLVQAMTCRKVSETVDLVLIRAGATLLTPWERFWYFLTILALAVLVCAGIKKAVEFYAHSIQAVMSR